MKCTKLNRRRGLKEVVQEVAVNGKQVKSQNSMILVKPKINCENTEKKILTNVALFPDTIAFKTHNVQVCRFNVTPD